jgi:hypothetical protein
VLDFLKDLDNDGDNYDAFLFLPTAEKDSIQVEGAKYVKPGAYVDSHELGLTYHILLFKEDKEGNMIHFDQWDAILGAPLEYISTLIPQGWFGVIAKKTTTSHIFIEKAIDNMGLA